MEYPREFSNQARAEVEAERLKGITRLARERKQVESRYQGPVEADEQNLRTYILRVFLVFVKQACNLNSELWSVDQIRKESEEFLRRFTIEAYYEQGYNRNNCKLPAMISDWSGGIKAEVMLKYRQSPEWQKYERQLLRAATTGSQRVKVPSTLVNDRKVASDRVALVDAYINEVEEKTGRKITRTDIWKKARYKSRTEFERWERNDAKRPNKVANERFTDILHDKPHLR